MKFPITFTFKLLAIASQIYVRDADGNLIGYVKQNLFKLKEHINLFTDESQATVAYSIKADRMIDFSARYSFLAGGERPVGSIKRQGLRSIWRANYEIFDENGSPVMKINEENGWVKVIDSVVGELPVIGLFTGYFLHPSYAVTDQRGKMIARLEKQPAFFEGVFRLELHAESDEKTEVLLMLGTLTMALLERSRG
ncbi:MAG: hypothetical protein IPM25_18735 [Chloracidobacterium sp.]|nr:hypothetical protein [Chloracidobacterium sp.]